MLERSGRMAVSLGMAGGSVQERRFFFGEIVEIMPKPLTGDRYFVIFRNT